MAEQQQDVDTLKRRGRRRLVGAVALVLLAVIVLPMVFDPEPRPVAPAPTVRIPGEDAAPFKPKPPAQKPAATEKKDLTKEEYFVPIGAFAAPENVTAKLAAAKYVADDGPNLWGWVIFPEGFHAPRIMELARLQAWTLKPAMLPH